jgi:hypothetical protein
MAFSARLRPSHLPALALALTAGMLLVGLALPRAVAGIVLLPVAETLRAIQFQEPVEPERLRRLVERQHRALAWAPRGRGWTDLALAQLLLSEAPGVAPEAHGQLVWAGIDSLRGGLASAPANPFAWTRLALAETKIAGPSTGAARALAMALGTAPYEPRLIFVRLELGFTLWSRLAPEHRARVLEQVRFAWRDDPERLVELALAKDAAGLVRAGLVRVPGARRKFERMLRARTSARLPPPYHGSGRTRELQDWAHPMPMSRL